MNTRTRFTPTRQILGTLATLLLLLSPVGSITAQWMQQNTAFGSFTEAALHLNLRSLHVASDLSTGVAAGYHPSIGGGIFHRIPSTGRWELVDFDPAPSFAMCPQYSNVAFAAPGTYYIAQKSSMASASGKMSTSSGASFVPWAPALRAKTLSFPVNASTGYASFYGVSRTDDGGATWTTRPFPSTGGFPMVNDMQFLTNDRGYVACQEGPEATMTLTGYIYSTLDGGGTWTLLATFPEKLFGLFCLDEQHIWSVGSHGIVVRSTDAGATWGVSQCGQDSLYGVHFINTLVGWAVGQHGKILKSVDGGATWQCQYSEDFLTADLRGIYMVSADEGYIVGDVGTILGTSNGGGPAYSGCCAGVTTETLTCGNPLRIHIADAAGITQLRILHSANRSPYLHSRLGVILNASTAPPWHADGVHGWYGGATYDPSSGVLTYDPWELFASGPLASSSVLGLWIERGGDEQYVELPIAYPQCFCGPTLACTPSRSTLLVSNGSTQYWNAAGDAWQAVPVHSPTPADDFGPRPPDIAINGVAPEWIWPGSFTSAEDNQAIFRIDFSLPCPGTGCLNVAVDDFCDVYLYRNTDITHPPVLAPWTTPCDPATPNADPPHYLGTAAGAYTSTALGLSPSNIFPLDLEAGQYTVVLVAWDGGRCPPSPLTGTIDATHDPTVHDRLFNALAYSLGMCWNDCDCHGMDVTPLPGGNCRHLMHFTNVNPEARPVEKCTLKVVTPGVTFAPPTVSPPSTWTAVFGTDPTELIFSGSPAVPAGGYAGDFGFDLIGASGPVDIGWRTFHGDTSVCKGVFTVQCRVDSCHTVDYEHTPGGCEFIASFTNANPAGAALNEFVLSIVPPSPAAFVTAGCTPPWVVASLTPSRIVYRSSVPVPVGGLVTGLKFGMAGADCEPVVLRWETRLSTVNDSIELCSGLDTLCCGDDCAFTVVPDDTCCCYTGTISFCKQDHLGTDFHLLLTSAGTFFRMPIFPPGRLRLQPSSSYTQLDFDIVPPLRPCEKLAFSFCLQAPRNRAITYSWAITELDNTLCFGDDTMYCCMDTCSTLLLTHPYPQSRTFTARFTNVNPYLADADGLHLRMLSTGGSFPGYATAPAGWSAAVSMDQQHIRFDSPATGIPLGASSGDYSFQVYRNCYDASSIPDACSVIVGWEILHAGHILCSGVDTLSWSLRGDPDPMIHVSPPHSCVTDVTVHAYPSPSEPVHEVRIGDDYRSIVMYEWDLDGRPAPKPPVEEPPQRFQPLSPNDIPPDWYLDSCSLAGCLVFRTTQPVSDTTGVTFHIGTVNGSNMRQMYIAAYSRDGAVLALDSADATCNLYSPCDRVTIEKTAVRHSYKVRFENAHMPPSPITSLSFITPDAGVMIHDVIPASGSWTCKMEREWEYVWTSVPLMPGQSAEFTVTLYVHPTVTSCRLIWQSASNLTYICSGEEIVDITLEGGASPAPANVTLYQNFPNPFNPATSIVYSVPRREFVSIDVYGPRGELVERLLGEMTEAGTYTALFDGSRYASGIYTVILRAGAESRTRRMQLIK